MPRLNQNLKDVDENDAGGTWRALPDGEYVSEIIKSEYVPTQAGTGMVLKLKFSVLEEGHHGKTIFDNLTLEHPKPETVDIARARLKQLAIGCGLPNPDMVADSEDLHSLPVLVKLRRVKSSNPRFGDDTGHENQVLAYIPVSQRGQAPSNNEEPPPPNDQDIPF